MDPLRRVITFDKGLALLEVVKELQKLDREVPAQVVCTYLYVATHDGCHSQAMMEDLELTAASASRNTDWLTKKHRLGKSGLDLIVKEIDPSNRRRQILRLTPKGKHLIHSICGTLYGDHDMG